MKKLSKIYQYLLYALPIVLFFSYWPVIALGNDYTMNFELSLPLIWLVIFGVVSVILFIQNRQKFNKILLWLLCVVPLPAFVSLSVIWSSNPVRGALTAGILCLIILAILSMVALPKQIFQDDSLLKIRRTLMKICRVSVLVVCGWCFLQCFLDIFGVGREVTLLCAGCTAQSFGFPHPNGFAIEPQFMGNLLLLPALYGVYYFIEKRPKFWSFKTLEILVIIATLFLTFSRGAIYAFGVAMIFMIIFFVIKQKTAKPILTLVPVVIAFLFTLNMQGVFAAISKTNDTYLSGVAKVVDQLSLGVIDFTEVAKPKVEVEETVLPEADFDGYVEESTDVRLSLSTAAIEVWQKDKLTMLFGVGIGGAGTALYENGYTETHKEIVQNQYVSLLLETGIVGVVCLMIEIGVVIYAIKNGVTHPSRVFFWGVLIAYGLSLLFFSGLPNALHIYLFPSLAYVIWGMGAKTKSKVLRGKS